MWLLNSLSASNLCDRWDCWCLWVSTYLSLLHSLALSSTAESTYRPVKHWAKSTFCPYFCFSTISRFLLYYSYFLVIGEIGGFICGVLLALFPNVPIFISVFICLWLSWTCLFCSILCLYSSSKAERRFSFSISCWLLLLIFVITESFSIESVLLWAVYSLSLAIGSSCSSIVNVISGWAL